MSYLQNGITTISGLEYWFDSKKESDVGRIESEFQNMMLIKYDAVAGSLKRALEIPSLKEKKLGVRSFMIYGNYIYFTATDNTQVVANTVGILDYNTLELLWHEKVSPGNLKLDPPQVTEDKLYVLGAEGTLHIFGKD